MPETTAARMATLSGGISKLKAEVRSPGQVADALNTDFSLQHQCAKRAGTSHLYALGASAPTSVWLMCKALEGGQKPVIYAGSSGSVQVFDSSGAAATVVAKPSATTYLAAGTETSRPHTAGKTGTAGCVRIVNPAVTPLAEASDAATVAREHINFETLVGHTGTTIGEVRRVLESTTADRPAALYRYEPGVTTPSTATFDWAQASAHLTEIVKTTKNPQAAKVWFPKFGMSAVAGTYTVLSRTINSVGAFTNYTFEAGDKVFLSAGGTVGAHLIEKKFDSDNIILATDIGEGAVTMQGIGMEIEFEKDFAANPPATLDEYALGLQQAIRDAGATNACVGWIPTDLLSDKSGQIVLTNHYSGALANFNSNAGMVIRAPSAGPYSLLTADACFEDTTPTVVNGNGDGTALSPFERWKVRPVNDQGDAVPDPDTLPIVVKPVQGFGANTTYYNAMVALKPVAYWRLGERYGTGVFDSASDALGVATNTPTLNATSLLSLSGDTNPAMTFGATESVEFASGIPNIRRRGLRAEQLAFSCLFKTTNNTDRLTAFCIKNTSGGAVTQFRVDLNWDGSSMSAGHIYLYAKNGEVLRRTTSAIASLYDGNLHSLIVNSSGFWVDGAAVATTDLSPSGPFAAVTSDAGYASISDASTAFLGTLDEVALLDLTITDAFAAWMNTRARGTNSTALYMVGTEDWAPRTNGDATTNPVPTFIKDGIGITAATNWEGRFAVGAGRTFSTSRAQEEAAFYVKDVSTVTDAAPIDRVVAGADASKITSLTPFGSICVALTDGPSQYELSAADALSIGTLNSRVGITQRVAAVDPVLAGGRLYVVAPTASGTTINGTLLEGEIDEQAVSGFYDDVGQHVRGLINPASIDDLAMGAVTSDGKVILAERGGERLFVYQTAWIGAEKRQSAWSTWDIGGTIKAVCAVDESILMVVLRSGKYILEKWKPEPPEQWPTSAQRMDGRLSVASVSHGAGVTTFTMPTDVPATGIDTAIKSDGTILAATPISSTQFTVPGTLHPITVTAGRSHSAYVTLSRPYQRDLNGQAYIGQSLTHAYVILTATDLTKISATVTVDTRTPASWPVRALGHETTRGRVWTRGPVDRTVITLTLSGAAPVSIGTCEQVLDTVASRT